MESDFQKKLIDFLNLVCPIVIRVNAGRFRRGGRYISGAKKGTPDIIGMTHKGKFFGIEVKSKDGKPTNEQIKMIEEIKSKCGIGLIVLEGDNFDEISKELEL